MISEVNFSRGYSSFWTEYLPWIIDYVNSINKGLIARVQSPISNTNDTIHRSINNIVAFALFKNVVKDNNHDVNLALAEAIEIIKNYPRNNLETYSLSKSYLDIILMQSERLLNRYKQKSIEFYPQFPGCGIMESCEGDLYFENTLIEIKAGERGVLSSDIKQIIIYCALNWLSRTPKTISQIELYNPRQGILWESSVNDIILSISYLPAEDLFDQIGKYLSGMSEDIAL
jgi:hypothetical protein